VAGLMPVSSSVYLKIQKFKCLKNWFTFTKVIAKIKVQRLTAHGVFLLRRSWVRGAAEHHQHHRRSIARCKHALMIANSGKAQT